MSDVEKAENSGVAARPASQNTLTAPLDTGSKTQSLAMDEEKAPPPPVPPPGAQKGTEESQSADPNAVGWDGPDDPNNPLNWSNKKKWSNILALSLMTLLTPLGSSMFAPGVPDIMKEFKSTNANLATFVVSIYVLGFAFGPLIAAPLSEIYGRAPCYNISNLLFIIFTVATALSKNMGMLIAFRFLMGLAGSTPITNGSGTVADMFPIHQRGKAMSIWAMGPLLGPCIGPVAGGFMVESIGWRWVFWVIAIAAGVISVVCYFLVTETYHPTLLRAKVKKLKKETGNQDLYSVFDDSKITSKRRFELAILRPTKLLFTHPAVFIISFYIAIVYGTLYLMFSTFAFVFEEQYGFSTGIIGLVYTPTGVGMFFGTIIFGAIADKTVKKRMEKGGTPVPEDRIPLWLTLPTGVIIVVSLFWYGWAVESKTHWIVPMIAVALFCFGLLGIMMCLRIYLVDAYLQYAASVSAAFTFLRSLAGALLPLAGLSMYDKIGIGWGNSVLAFITLLLVPIPVIFLYYGAQIRAKAPKNL